MNQQWENTFKTWAQSPSKSEQERSQNAETAVRKAIAASSKLNKRNIKVFPQGSYRNRTNVRQDSDVDIGILCYDTFFYENLPLGMTATQFGISPPTYGYEQFKNEVGEALVSHFGAGMVKRGNKAFDIRENTYHLEADVAPFFEYRRYFPTGTHMSGVKLVPDNLQPTEVVNWPEQHYVNGNTKNDQTQRRYRALARILKNLRNDMDEKKRPEAGPIIGFLSECLVWNVPNDNFGSATYWDDLRNVLIAAYTATNTDASAANLKEVSGLKNLFGANQKWSRQQANDFITAAWRYVGFS